MLAHSPSADLILRGVSDQVYETDSFIQTLAQQCHVGLPLQSNFRSLCMSMYILHAVGVGLLAQDNHSLSEL